MHKNHIPFETLKKKTNFYFLRHGESEGNRKKMIQGHVDMPLTDLGRDHAKAAGEFFKDIQIDSIFASPLSRAFETAKLVAAESGIDESSIVQSDLLKELDTGLFSGMTMEEIQQQYPREWDAFQHHSWEAVPSAERVHELMDRAMGIWKMMIEAAQNGNQQLLSVSHGGMIQWIFKLSFSDQWTNWLPVTRTGNCGIYHLTVTPVPGDLGVEGPGFYSEWTRINFLPY